MSLNAGWPGAKIVFFDCDSTLAAIEGIDELAARRGVDVATLTAAAMAGEIPLDQVFRTRLQRIAPTADDLQWLAERYWQTRTPMAQEVLDALQVMGIACHVLSGGLLPAVQPFAERLGIPPQQVHAVPFPLETCSPDDAINIACSHPLARDGGKPELIQSICQAQQIHPRHALVVGDGASDLETQALVGLFVGFGGVVSRAKLQQHASVFVSGPTLADVALFAAGSQLLPRLQSHYPSLLAACSQSSLSHETLHSRPHRSPS